MATDKAAVHSLRESAVRAVSGFPNGIEILWEWKHVADDEILRAEAARILESKSPGTSAAPEEKSLQEIIRDLKSFGRSPSLYPREAEADVLKAIARAAAIRGSKELLGALRDVVLRNDQTSAAVKLAAIAAVAKQNSADAAAVLGEIAVDPELEIIVRTNAVLSISEIESGISIEILSNVSKRSDDPQIRKLASALSRE